MLRGVIAIKEWVNLFLQMKFHKSLRYSLDPSKNGIWILLDQLIHIENKKKNIHICTHYVTKWVEAKELSFATKNDIASFIL